MTAFYGDFDRDAQEEESLKTISKALELGINMLDTAWIYQVMPATEPAFVHALTVRTLYRLLDPTEGPISPTKRSWARPSKSMVARSLSSAQSSALHLTDR